jgi:hypothetical protein
MKANPLFLLEFVLFDGGVLAFCAWQWWTVRPRRDKPKDSSASESSESRRETPQEP